MAGRPKTRARREAERAAQGQIPARHVPRVPAAEWRALSHFERFKVNLGMSEDDAHTLLSIPWEEADLHEKVLKIRVFEVYMKWAARLGIEQQRDRGREEAVAALSKALAERVVGDVATPLQGFAGGGDVG